MLKQVGHLLDIAHLFLDTGGSGLHLRLDMATTPCQSMPTPNLHQGT
jgi:hypothetical protein